MSWCARHSGAPQQTGSAYNDHPLNADMCTNASARVASASTGDKILPHATQVLLRRRCRLDRGEHGTYLTGVPGERLERRRKGELAQVWQRGNARRDGRVEDLVGREEQRREAGEVREHRGEDVQAVALQFKATQADECVHRGGQIIQQVARQVQLLQGRQRPQLQRQGLELAV